LLGVPADELEDPKALPSQTLEAGELRLDGYAVRSRPVDQIDTERKNRLGGGFRCSR
jgi:hypothetical protein